MVKKPEIEYITFKIDKNITDYIIQIEQVMLELKKIQRDIKAIKTRLALK